MRSRCERGQKQQSSVDVRGSGLEPGTEGTMWVGLVYAGGSVDMKVSGVDITSGIAMWVNDMGTGNPWVGGVHLGGKVHVRVNVVDIGDGMT